MDILTQFEEKIERLLERIRSLEAEKVGLQEQLNTERSQKQEVLDRIDGLLKKIQEVSI